jgi:iron(III) transport system substrate-binding protein
MTRWTAALLASLVCGLAVHCGTGARAQEAVATFGREEAATTLTIRSTTDIEALAPALEAFVARSPNVRIFYEQWNSNALYGRALEACAGRAESADMVISSAIHQMVKLVNDGCSRPHVSAATARLSTHLNWRDELFGITREPAAMVYNRDLVAPEEAPRSRFDLLDLLRPNDSRFYGRVATYDIERSGLGYLFAFLDAQQATTFGSLLEAFGRSGAVTTCCSAEIIDAVADGRYLIAYNVLGSYALARAEEDSRIVVVYPEDYTLVLSRGAIISRRADNPEAAGAFLDFLLSDAGRLALSESKLIVPLGESGSADLGFPDGASSVFRPIPLSPALLVALDRHKRKLFIERWESVLKPGL